MTKNQMKITTGCRRKLYAYITEAKIDVWVEYLSLLKLQFLNYQQKNQKIK